MRDDVEIPPLTPGWRDGIPAAELRSLFRELQKREAFNMRVFLHTGAAGVCSDDRDLLVILRGLGYCRRPKSLAGASGWSTGNGRYFVSPDHAHYRNVVEG